MTQIAQDRTIAPVRHPLAPLTVNEVATACRLALGSGVGRSARVVYCALVEPPKEAVIGWDGRTPLGREVLCVLYDQLTGAPWLVTVSLDQQSVASQITGAQPPIMTEEWLANAEQIKADEIGRAHV